MKQWTESSDDAAKRSMLHFLAFLPRFRAPKPQTRAIAPTRPRLGQFEHQLLGRPCDGAHPLPSRAATATGIVRRRMHRRRRSTGRLRQPSRVDRRAAQCRRSSAGALAQSRASARTHARATAVCGAPWGADHAPLGATRVQGVRGLWPGCAGWGDGGGATAATLAAASSGASSSCGTTSTCWYLR